MHLLANAVDISHLRPQSIPMIARLLVVTGLLLSSPLIAAEPSELTGVWKLVSLDSEGGVINLPSSPHLLEIKGGKLIYGRKVIADVVADASMKPKTIDLRFTDDDTLYEGIYIFEKETNALKICLNLRTKGIKARPDSLAHADHPDRRLLTFVRVSDDDAGPGRGFIGMGLKFDKDLSVLVIYSVLQNTPAKDAGLLEGDQLLAIEGVAVTGFPVETMRKATPGSKLLLKIRRDDAEREIAVSVAVFPFRQMVGLK